MTEAIQSRRRPNVHSVFSRMTFRRTNSNANKTLPACTRSSDCMVHDGSCFSCEDFKANTASGHLKQSPFTALQRRSRRVFSNDHVKIHRSTTNFTTDSSNSSAKVYNVDLDEKCLTPMPSECDSLSSESQLPIVRLSTSGSSTVSIHIEPPARNMYTCTMAGCHKSFSRFFQLKNHTINEHGLTSVSSCLKTEIEESYRSERLELAQKAAMSTVPEVI